MDRRLGRFQLPMKMVETHPHHVMNVMSQCIVVRCELMYDTMSLHYVAISTTFDPIPNGAVVPEYNVVVDIDNALVSFYRKKE